MASKIPDAHHDASRVQQIRLDMLSPARLVAEFRRARRMRTGGMEYVHAIASIRITGSLRCSPAERVEHIDRILAALDVVTREDI